MIAIKNEYEPGNKKAGRKILGKKFRNEYYGEDAPLISDIPCRICGGVQYFVEWDGNRAIYGCKGKKCPNNPDTDIRDLRTRKANYEMWQSIGNQRLLWNPPKKRIGFQPPPPIV